MAIFHIIFIGPTDIIEDEWELSSYLNLDFLDKSIEADWDFMEILRVGLSSRWVAGSILNDFAQNVTVRG